MTLPASVETVLGQHFNGKPTEMHYGCNKYVIPIHEPKRKRPCPPPSK